MSPMIARVHVGTTQLMRLLSATLHDRGGATAVVAGLVSTALIGFAGLGSETGLWYYTYRSMQAAADSSALGAAAALLAADGTSYAAEAKATAARYGFVDGASHV